MNHELVMCQGSHLLQHSGPELIYREVQNRGASFSRGLDCARLASLLMGRSSTLIFERLDPCDVLEAGEIFLKTSESIVGQDGLRRDHLLGDVLVRSPFII